MAKYTPTETLASDETRLKRYGDLSRGAKMEMDLARRAHVKDTEEVAKRGDSTGRRVSDTVSKVLLSSPLNINASRDVGEVNADRDARERKRQDAAASARSDANYDDVTKPGSSRRLYGDMAPGKLKDEPLFKAGGPVKSRRGWGKARGA